MVIDLQLVDMTGPAPDYRNDVHPLYGHQQSWSTTEAAAFVVERARYGRTVEVAGLPDREQRWGGYQLRDEQEMGGEQREFRYAMPGLTLMIVTFTDRHLPTPRLGDQRPPQETKALIIRPASAASYHLTDGLGKMAYWRPSRGEEQLRLKAYTQDFVTATNSATPWLGVVRVHIHSALHWPKSGNGSELKGPDPTTEPINTANLVEVTDNESYESTNGERESADYDEQGEQPPCEPTSKERCQMPDIGEALKVDGEQRRAEVTRMEKLGVHLLDKWMYFSDAGRAKAFRTLRDQEGLAFAYSIRRKTNIALMLRRVEAGGNCAITIKRRIHRNADGTCKTETVKAGPSREKPAGADVVEADPGDGE
jgi:hypothetical protein